MTFLKSMRLSIIILSTLVITNLVGCSTRQSMMSAPDTAGVSNVIPYPMETVINEARKIVTEKWTYDNEARYTKDSYAIFFHKPMSVWSWGEVGRIMVKNEGKSCRVYVHSEKRSTYQIPGTDEHEFARIFFEELEVRLPSFE